MTPGGRIALACDAPHGRTRLRTIRCSGLSRTSRALAAPAGAIRVMLAMLGPGAIAGDRYTLEGSLAPGASLVAGSQMATPVFAGAAPSQTDACWNVDAGALLVSAGEPLLLEPGSVHHATATFALSGDATAIVADVFALRGAARLAMRTSATVDGALVYRDAIDAGGESAGAFGTVAFIGGDASRREAFARRARALAAGTAAARIGVGATDGAAVVRVFAARVWDVRRVVHALAQVPA